MYDAADVWTHGVDGSVGAETCRVDPQVGGALFDHIPNDVDLHLGKQREEAKSLDASWISALQLELVDVKLTVFTSNLFSFLF